MIKKKRLIFVDCTEEPATGTYYETVVTRVVHTKAGAYRETEATAQARFGYRFTLRDKSKPHLLEVVYPDDARRTMCVCDGTTYDMSTGVCCGGRYTNSDEMLTLHLYFYPRREDTCVVFSSWGEGERAAVAGFSVFELESLPDAGCEETGRDFGVQYEDPTNVGSSEGATDYVSWGERIIEYLRFTGQNLLIFPVNWYHGPFVPVGSQPFGALNSYIGEDLRQYSRTTTKPNDWADELMNRFDEMGLSFIGSLTLLRLGGLMAMMERETGDKGDTIRNVLGDGCLQSSVNDWTVEYNPLTFHTIPEHLAATGKKGPYAYNEIDTSGKKLPIFNPLHPEVRRQTRVLFFELAGKYARHPSFKGLSINFWHGTFLWYGTLFAGYDDTAMSQFTRETGIRIPDDETEERFRQRYEFISSHCREEFIQWRCKKIHCFLLELRDILRSTRPDLTLTLTIWNEPSAFGLLDGVSPQTQYGMRQSNYRMYREGGLDLNLFREDEGIVVSLESNHFRDRTGWGVKGITAPVEETQMFTDFAFLDAETADVLRENHSAAFIFNCWAEAWGKHGITSAAPDDPNLPQILSLPDYRAEHVLTANSEYEDDPPENRRFFFDSQLRITAGFPAGVWFREWLVEPLAQNDPLSFTAGGLYLDRAHREEILSFAREFRRLPKQTFQDTPYSDPVTVRWLYVPEKDLTYVYCVNREPYLIGMQWNGLTQTLKPFSLLVLTFPGEQPPGDISFNLPEEIPYQRRQTVEELQHLLRKTSSSDEVYPALVRVTAEAEQALSRGAFARVRHLGDSYPAVKSRQMDLTSKN